MGSIIRKGSYLAAAVVFLVMPFFAQAYTKPGNPNGFVNDYAKVLSADQKAALEQTLSSYEKQTTNEISVVTIPTLGGDTIENYAVNLFKDWGIGKKGKDNGVLLLIAMQEHQMRIEVGYGLEPVLTDLDSFHIINDTIKPLFRQNNYGAGITQGVNQIITKIGGGQLPYQQHPKSSITNSGDVGTTVIIIIFLGFFLLVLGGAVLHALAASKSWWAGGAIGAVIAGVCGFIFASIFLGVGLFVVLVPLGLLVDFFASRSYARASALGKKPWWMNSGRRAGFIIGSSGLGDFGGEDDSGSDESSGGFGGFGGGGSGGGGASGGW